MLFKMLLLILISSHKGFDEFEESGYPAFHSSAILLIYISVFLKK